MRTSTLRKNDILQFIYNFSISKSFLRFFIVLLLSRCFSESRGLREKEFIIYWTRGLHYHRWGIFDLQFCYCYQRNHFPQYYTYSTEK